MSKELALEAKNLCEEGRIAEAWDIAEDMLEEAPNEANPLILASFVCWKMQKLPVAYQLGIRATQVAPYEATAWINLGIAAQEMWLVDEAESAYKTAIRLAKNKTEKGMALMNLSATYIDTGRFKEAEATAKEGLKLSDNPKLKANYGFGLLGQGKWEGWDWYSYSLGLRSRLAMQYQDESPWDGTLGKTVVFYGEQGLGDEISFASMIPEAIRDCEKVIIDCDPKLSGLFKRSFPQAKVYGTRSAKASDGVKWDAEDWNIDASLALGELGKFYRKKTESFTVEPYLTPDPDRRVMWRHLFDKKKKPVIGLAWSGGIPQTGQKFRTIKLEQLKPILESIDAHWVSLQYKDASQEISEFKKQNPSIDINQYAWATLTKDYDDTAAMVAELDLVISVDTAVVHLCGAIGKECWMLLHKFSQWRWGEKGDTTHWYKNLQIIRQGKAKDWVTPVGEVVGRLRKRYELKAAA